VLTVPVGDLGDAPPVGFNGQRQSDCFFDRSSYLNSVRVEEAVNKDCGRALVAADLGVIFDEAEAQGRGLTD
jgi:hypothetical protein